MQQCKIFFMMRSVVLCLLMAASLSFSQQGPPGARGNVKIPGAGGTTIDWRAVLTSQMVKGKGTARCLEVTVARKNNMATPEFWLCGMIRTDKKGAPTKNWRRVQLKYEPGPGPGLPKWSCVPLANGVNMPPSFYFGCFRVPAIAAGGGPLKVICDCTRDASNGSIKDIPDPASLYMDVLIGTPGKDFGGANCPGSGPNVNVIPDQGTNPGDYANWWMATGGKIPLKPDSGGKELALAPIQNWYLMGYPRVLQARLRGIVESPIEGSTLTFLLPNAPPFILQVPLEHGNCFSSIPQIPIDIPFTIPLEDTTFGLQISYDDTANCPGIPSRGETMFTGEIVVDGPDTTGYYQIGDTVVHATLYFFGDNDKPQILSDSVSIELDTLVVNTSLYDSTSYASAIIRYQLPQDTVQEDIFTPLGGTLGDYNSFWEGRIPLPTSPVPSLLWYSIIAEDAKGNRDSTNPTWVSPQQVSSDWNMLSLPLRISGADKSTLFPHAATNAFTFSGTYVPQPSLSHGMGFWLKFDQPEQIALRAELPLPVDTEAVTIGWNIIGSISAALPVSHITSQPPGIVTSNFFGYDGIGYYVTDTIYPGKAYWVRVSQNGQLILSSLGTSQKNAIRIVPTSEVPPNPPSAAPLRTGKNLTSFELKQNYPNPGNPLTRIEYSLPTSEYVQIRIFDLLGRELAVLVDEVERAGDHTIEFDANGLASGVYFFQMQAGRFSATRKMLITR